MACCPMAPSYYLNQWWYLISKIFWHSFESNFTVSLQATILYNEFENHTFRVTATSPRGQWVNTRLILPWLSWSIFHENIALYWPLPCRHDTIHSDTCDWLMACHAGTILCMRPANERQRYIVTSSLIGCMHTQNDPCHVVITYISFIVCSRIKRFMSSKNIKYIVK